MSLNHTHNDIMQYCIINEEAWMDLISLLIHHEHKTSIIRPLVNNIVVLFTQNY